jgi:exodeoxyribonuclease VII small subunit
MTKSHSPEAQDSFESGIKELEQLVNSLENGNLDIDKALVAFEKGVALSRKLAEKLSQAEARLEILSKSPDGQLTSSPLSLSADTGQAEPGKKAAGHSQPSHGHDSGDEEEFEEEEEYDDDDDGYLIDEDDDE